MQRQHPTHVYMVFHQMIPLLNNDHTLTRNYISGFPMIFCIQKARKGIIESSIFISL